MKYTVIGAVALSMVVGAAQAATYKYELSDHPSGTNANAPHYHNYGLRLDQYSNKHFSFDGASTAKLVYNSHTGVATISGTVIESVYGVAGPANGPTWDLFYSMSGVTDLGNGFFRDYAGLGTGSVSYGGTVLQLGAKAKMEKGTPPWFFQILDDGHRTTSGSTVAYGWVNHNQGGGSNDFLLTAELSTVPLPAAGMMLLAGLAGLGGLRAKRSRKTA